ncbi:conserved hypothetical protein [Mucor ambiguus]|uniref:Restriction of telomere capping protein 4 n=1 Tax=Mucor ambiguus TaxID=91626 RepID=A0A0C9N6F8_9FUNG|nr:conserved hypothetical protein [Mucor ambiguus]
MPPKTRKGFMAPLDAHQIKREEEQTSKKRRSSLSTDEEDENDGDFRSYKKPKDTLKMPKKLTGSASSNSLHIPAKRSNLSSSSMKTDEIFESAPSPPDSSQTAIKLPTKKEVNPFASDRETLKVPAKKKAKMDVDELQRMQGSLVEGQKNNERKPDEYERKCDFCGEQLWPITESIQKALQELDEKNEAYVKRQNRHYQEMQAASSFSAPTGFVVSRPVPNEEKDKFCRLHRKQLVTIPEGIRKNYPRQIDFSKIEKRIRTFSTELEQVIRGVITSDYKAIAENAYREQGQSKARSVMSVLNRFTATLPGYYGPMGAAVILKVLTQMYINTGYMQKHLKSSQLPLEFLQQVLVPEVGFRLIRQDLMSKKKGAPVPLSDKAKVVMKESAAYGNAMFPVEDADIDDDRVFNISHNHQDEDEDGDENKDDDEEDGQVETNEVYAIDSD